MSSDLFFHLRGSSPWTGDRFKDPAMASSPGKEAEADTTRSTSGSSDSSTCVERKKRWSAIRLRAVEDPESTPCASVAGSEVSSPEIGGVYDLTKMLHLRTLVTDCAEEYKDFKAMTANDVDAAFVAHGAKPPGYELPSRTQERRRQRAYDENVKFLSGQGQAVVKREKEEVAKEFVKFYDALEEDRWFDCFADEETMLRVTQRNVRSSPYYQAPRNYDSSWRNTATEVPETNSPHDRDPGSALLGDPRRMQSSEPEVVLEPIPVSENAYVVTKPETRAKTANLFRSVNALLNKVAPQTLDVLTVELTELFTKEVESAEDMDIVCKQFVRKAMLDVHYIETYAGIAFGAREQAASEDEKRTFADALVEAVEKEFVEVLPAEDEDSAAHMERVEEKKKRCLGLATFASELLKVTVMDLDIFEEHLRRMMKATSSEVVLEMLIEAVSSSGSRLDDEMLDTIVAHLKELDGVSCKRVQFLIRDALEMAEAKFENLCAKMKRLADQKAKRLSRVKAEADAENAAIAERDAERVRIQREHQHEVNKARREERKRQAAERASTQSYALGAGRESYASYRGSETWQNSSYASVKDMRGSAAMAPMSGSASGILTMPRPCLPGFNRGSSAPERASQGQSSRHRRQQEYERERELQSLQLQNSPEWQRRQQQREAAQAEKNRKSRAMGSTVLGAVPEGHERPSYTGKLTLSMKLKEQHDERMSAEEERDTFEMSVASPTNTLSARSPSSASGSSSSFRKNGLGKREREKFFPKASTAPKLDGQTKTEFVQSLRVPKKKASDFRRSGHTDSTRPSSADTDFRSSDSKSFYNNKANTSFRASQEKWTPRKYRDYPGKSPKFSKSASSTLLTFPEEEQTASVVLTTPENDDE